MPTFDILRNETDVRAFAAGETIFEAGAPAHHLFVVVEGVVEIHLHGKVVERVEPLGVFGEMALIDGLPRSASAVAATDCRVAAIDEKRFLRLVELLPNFSLRVMRLVTERLRRANPV